MPKSKIFLFASLCMLATSHLAQAADNSFVPKMPQDFNQVEMYLHTIDLGELVHEKYGHTQIRVHDKLAGTDVSYTWGLFNYQDPNFALKFYRGIMKYQIGAFQTAVAHRIYEYEGRQVWEDRFELTNAQKQRLMERIIFQMRPENREYDYQYFFDNCSTRPRDFIDTALNGKFREKYFSPLSDLSFRDTVRVHQATTPLSGLGLEVTMNGRLDRKMTQWEEMYLPKSLRKYAMSLPRFDDNGDPVPDSSLLTPITVYFPKPTPEADYHVDDAIAFAALGIIPAFTLVFLRRRRKLDQAPRKLTPFDRTVGRFFGVCLMIWALLSFTFGTVMLVSWFCSNHLDLKHNANLWLFWPFDFILLIPALGLILRGTIAAETVKFSRLIYQIVSLHIMLACICGILAVFGVIQQDVSRVFAVFGVCGLMIYLALLQILDRNFEKRRA